MEISFGTLAAIFVAMGLITTDAVINANSLYVDVHVPPPLEHRGYSEEVVQGEIVDEMRRIANQVSMVSAPRIRSSASESISVALADLANLGDTMKDVQSLVGYAPPKITVAILEDDGELKLKASGMSRHTGQILVEVEQGEGSVRDMIRTAARETMRHLEPYNVLLDEFEANLDDPATLKRIEATLAAEIKALPATPLNRDRANFENLEGIIDLHLNWIDQAELHFRRSIAAAPGFKVPRLNLAFVLVQKDDYQGAIDLVSEMIDPWYWPQFRRTELLAAGHIIRGVAYWGLGQYDKALADLSYAATLNPTSTEAYVYWGRLLEELGRKKEAAEKFWTAQQNLLHFENYPEVALLYFWLTEKDGEPLRRRNSEIVKLELGRH